MNVSGIKAMPGNMSTAQTWMIGCSGALPSYKESPLLCWMRFVTVRFQCGVCLDQSPSGTGGFDEEE